MTDMRWHVHEPATEAEPSGVWSCFLVGLLAVSATCLLVLLFWAAIFIWFSWVFAIIVARALEYLRLPFSMSLQSNSVDGLFAYPFPLNFQLLPEYQLAFLADKFDPVAFLTASVMAYASCFAAARRLAFGRSTRCDRVLLSSFLACRSAPDRSTRQSSDRSGPQWLTVAMSLFCLASFVVGSLWMCASITRAAVPVMLGLGWFAVAFVFVVASRYRGKPENRRAHCLRPARDA